MESFSLLCLGMLAGDAVVPFFFESMFLSALLYRMYRTATATAFGGIKCQIYPFPFSLTGKRKWQPFRTNGMTSLKNHLK
mmetsp:Transcript_23494/g.28880  ORF Transcript_23494/g.28880 Transcript_23494/m.28880 type:complete len:80 (-) Transcript_23494:659-898(-)